jgi:hypothetical protein
MLMTLPGVPELFTGDEIGAWYEPYSTLTPLDWRDHPRLRDYYRKLISIRESTPSLRSRDFEPVALEPFEAAYGYVRPASPGDGAVLVLLNFGNRTTFSLPNRSALGGLGGSSALRDLLGGETLHVADGGPLKIPMQPKSARILVEAAPS